MTATVQDETADDGAKQPGGKHQAGADSLTPPSADCTLGRGRADARQFGIARTTADGDRVDLPSLVAEAEQMGGTTPGQAALLIVHHAALQAVLRYGSRNLQSRHIEDMRSGNLVCALAITEPDVSGSNLRGLTSKAVRDGDDWVMSGAKSAITGAPLAAFFVTLIPFIVEGGVALTAVLVPSDSPGVTIQPPEDMYGLWSVPISGVRYENVRIQSWQILGEVGSGVDVIGDSLLVGRICAGAISLGVLKRCAQLMYRFASRRQVSTGRLADDPVFQRRISRITAEIAAVEALLSTITTEFEVPQEIALALKVASSEFAHRATDDAMQTLGWRGYMEASGVAELMRDVRFLRIGEGPSEALLTELGSRLAAHDDTIYDWIADRDPSSDATSRLRETVSELTAESSTGLFCDLGWFGVWAILDAVVPRGSAASALIENAWHLARVSVAARPATGSDFLQSIPNFADSVGTLDEFLSCHATEIDPTLHPTRGKASQGEPLVGPEAPGWQETVHDLVYAQIARTPDAIALRDASGHRITYAELGEHADALANRLRAQGVRNGDVVGVFLSRDARMAIAAIAVLRAGAVLLMLNPAHPTRRVRDMIADADVGCIVADEQTRALLPANAPELIIADGSGEPGPVISRSDPRAPAYIYFTSGSTGRPKPVLISHRSLANQLLWRRDELGLGVGDAVLQTTEPTFDIFLWEIFGPLSAGGRLVFPALGPGEWNAHQIVEHIRRLGITAMQFVPSQLAVVLEEPRLRECRSLRYVFCGGEPLPIALCRRVAEALPHAEMVNYYGATETTFDASFWRVDVTDTATWAPIGRPIANVRLYIVDEEGALVPEEQAGELWIGGACVGMGYRGLPALTAERFRPDVRSAEPDAKVYRTGDRVRQRADGTLEFLGRMDRQLKLRGVRIEPTEVERALCGHPGVQQAVVDIKERGSGERVLAAYIVARTPEAVVDPDAVLETARRKLPSTMVPGAVIVLDALPRTPAGKVDTSALPPVPAIAGAAGSSALPERLVPLANIWEEILGTPVTNQEADFFRIGGHSLAASRVIIRVRERMGVTLQLRDFVHAGTLTALGDLIEQRSGQVSPADEAAMSGPTPADRSTPLPLAPMQANLWYLQQLVPTMTAYNIPAAVRIRGPVDVARIEGAFTSVAARHEALRTIFPEHNGQPTQVILPPGPIPLQQVDLRDLPEDDREPAAIGRIQEMLALPFDLSDAPPVRVLLTTVAEDDHYLAWSMHHIVADGWSAAGLLNSELSRAYGTSPDDQALPRLPIQPIDYEQWMVHWLTAQRRAALEGYWRDQLCGAPPEIDLPRDFVRPSVGKFRGARVPISIGDGDRAALRDMARRHGATPYSVLVAAFTTWVAGRGQQRDIVVGGVTAGRNHSSIEHVIGNFASILPLRCRLGDNPTFAELVVRTRDEIRAMVDHSALSFPDIVNVVRPERLGTRNPIFQAAVSLFDGDISPLRIDGAQVNDISVDPGSAKFDLLASFTDDGTALWGFLEYDVELFSQSTAGRLAAEFVEALGLLARTPGCRIEDYVDRLRSAPDIGPAPLTLAQQRIWLLDRLNLGGPELCSQRYFDLRGEIDVTALCQALDLLVQRHPALRTVFPSDERGAHQIVGMPADVAVHDLRDHNPAEREVLLTTLVESDAATPIDITTTPPLRATLFVVDEGHVVLGMNCHHIGADVWAEATMFAELSNIYAELGEDGANSKAAMSPGTPFAEVAATRTMGELAHAEIADASRPPNAASVEFWTATLSDVPGRLELPTDLPQPPVLSFRGARVEVRLPGDILRRLDDFAMESGVDRSTVVLGMWQHLLHRYSGQETVLVGVPVPNRPSEVPPATIGYFSNLLPVRSDLLPELTLRAQSNRTATQLAEVTAHGEIPFADLLERFGTRLQKSASLTEVSFVPEIALARGPRFDRVQTTPVPHDPKRALFKLGLVLQSDDKDLYLTFDFSTALWAPRTIERMAQHLVTLLTRGLAEPDVPLRSFAMLTDHEIEELRSVDGRRDIPHRHRTLHLGFEAQVDAAPKAEAVRSNGSGLTYAELDAAANQLARLLMSNGVVRGDKVALLLERTHLIPIAVLAIVKTGAAYVPIDASWPASRAELVLADSAPSAILTESSLRHVVAGYDTTILELDSMEISDQPTQRVQVEVDSEDVAYVIYTSGSTGRPKGVEVTHHNVMRLFSATEELFTFTNKDRWSMFHSIAFDFSVWELWGALLHGGCVVVVPYLVTRNPVAFRELLTAERITVLNQTPSAFRILRDADANTNAGLFLRYVIFGGENLSFADLLPWIDAHGDARPELINMYGITETTVHVTFRRVRREDVLGANGSNIGRPLPDLECLLTDPAGNLVPYGVRGEICVGGHGLANGYLGQPELTSQRFIPHPFRGGERLYRSGDAGRRLPNGDIEYLGRLDNQVQLRGFRIELGDVEAALLALDGVSACHAMVRSDGGESRLVAYVVTHSGEQPEIGPTRRSLAVRLPDYMLPAAIVAVESLPLTVNGKIDQKALPEPKGASTPAASDGAAQTTATAVRTSTKDRDGAVLDQIRHLFAQALDLDSVASSDNFFEIGGDSMRAVRVSVKAKELGLAVSVQDLFQYQTPEELAAGLTSAESAENDTSGVESWSTAMLLESDFRAEGDRPATATDAYPLAALQAGMLFHSRVDGPSVYHDVFSYLVRAQWDETAFRAALDEITARHPILRTTFELAAYSQPLQIVHESVATPLTVVDLSGLSESDQEAALSRWMDNEAHSPIEWQSCTPFGVVIHLRDGNRFELGLTFHHALLDGWSVAELQRDLLSSYDTFRRHGAAPFRAPLQTSFRDFVALERQAERSASKVFWRKQLQGLETAHFTGERSGSSRLETTWWEFPRDIEARLSEVARNRRVPLKSTLLAAHMVVNARLAATDDVVSGLVVNGRPETDDSAHVLGMFLNTVPLRMRLTSTDYIGLIDEAFAAERAVLPHRRVPLRTIQRDIGIGELFQTAFNFVSLDQTRDTADPPAERSVTVRRKLIEHTNLPLVTVFVKENDTLGIGIEFDPRILQTEQVSAILDAYRDAVAAVANGGSAPLPRFGTEAALNLLHRTRRIAAHISDDARSRVREDLRRIWEDVLDRSVDTTDSVGDSGGDSIHALVLSERIAKAFACDPPLVQLLQGATVEQLAALLTD
ncbi:amino acid adenylation domain-containing protein [Mycobacterium marinum]|uniref:amino acid adenylation domain-containing protein n=1 Tax=Mycobacterium marinum TaxID=1781 RepID=UPI003569B84B